MINLRYHIVSITAVFLALGIGVTLGSSLIQRYTIDTLESRLDELGDRLDRTDGENRALRDELRDRDALASRLAEEGRSLFAGHLDQVPVVVLAAQGSNDELIADTRASLRAAGAEVSGTLVFTARWDELTEGEVAELSELLDRQLTNDEVARTIVLRRLGDELLAASEPPPEPEPQPEPDPEGAGDLGDPSIDAGAEPTEPSADPASDAAEGTGERLSQEAGDDAEAVPPGEGLPPGEVGEVDEPDPVPASEMVAALIELGYLEFFPDSAATPLPAYGARMVFVDDPASVLAPDRAVLPLLHAMMLTRSEPLPVVVASVLVEVDTDDDEDGRIVLETSSLVTAIREDDRLGQAVSTVDDADGFIGQASIVLAVADLADGVVGHYGTGEGADSLVPMGAA